MTMLEGGGKKNSFKLSFGSKNLLEVQEFRLKGNCVFMLMINDGYMYQNLIFNE